MLKGKAIVESLSYKEVFPTRRLPYIATNCESSSSSSPLRSSISFSRPTIISFCILIVYFAAKIQINNLLVVEMCKKTIDFHD